MEMFEALAFSERVDGKRLAGSNETTFWKPDYKQRENHRAQRAGAGRRRRLVGIFRMSCSNQARVHDFYLERHAQIPGAV